MISKVKTGSERDLFGTVFMKFTDFVKNCDSEICDEIDVVVVTNLISTFSVKFEKFRF